MNNHDAQFKKTALNIGTIMIIFLGLFYLLFGLLFAIVQTLINFLITDKLIANIITELSSGIIYLATFMIPALIYIPLSKKHKSSPNTTPKPQISFTNTTLIVFASIGIVTAAAYVNSLLASFFNVGGSLSSFSEPLTFAEFIVYTLTVAVVPAVCEEFLFRKTILAALSPYGEGFAIITSAILFGLMHQNILQIFYATMAGLAIGYAYARTRSYLCVFLIHFTNNFISVIQQYMSTTLSEKYATILGTILTATILVLAVISMIFLMINESKNKKVYEKGSFKTIDIPSSNYVKYELSFSPMKKFFLSPTVLFFTIIVSILCLITLFL